MGACVRRQTRGRCCCNVAPEVRGSVGHETGGMGLGATIDGCTCETSNEGEVYVVVM